MAPAGPSPRGARARRLSGRDSQPDGSRVAAEVAQQKIADHRVGDSTSGDSRGYL
jgi:hypothetical protein